MEIAYSPNDILTQEIKLFNHVNKFFQLVIGIYSKASLAPIYSVLSKVLKLLATVVLCVLFLPIGYILVVYITRKSSKAINSLLQNLPELSTSQLEQLNTIFSNVEGQNIHLDAEIIKVNSAPFIFRPLVLSIKDNLKQYVMLRNEIKTRINSDLDLFSEALNQTLPLGMDITEA